MLIPSTVPLCLLSPLFETTNGALEDRGRLISRVELEVKDSIYRKEI